MVRHQGGGISSCSWRCYRGISRQGWEKNLRTILESRLENLAHSRLKQIPSRTWLSLSVSFKITLSRQDYLWVLAVNPASRQSWCHSQEGTRALPHLHVERFLDGSRILSLEWLCFYIRELALIFRLRALTPRCLRGSFISKCLSQSVEK